MRTKLIAGALTLAVAGGSAGAVLAAGDPAPTLTFDVTAKAITLEGTPQIGTKLNRLVFDFQGAGQRAVALVELKPGVTQEAFAKALASMKDPTQVEDFGRVQAGTFVGGPTQYATTTELRDRDYAVLDTTRKPVVRLTFHAGPAANATAAVPREDMDVRLMDWHFSTPSRWKAGKRIVRVLNQGTHMHHALLAPLRPDADARSVLKQLRAGKEPRSALAGPPSALVEAVSPKAQNYVEVNLKKGRYVMVCFLQDSPKSRPHAMKGMEKVITVR